MQIEVISLFPDMFDALTGHGVTGRAVENGLLSLHIWNPRDYTSDNHRTVDDRPFGGGPGMVMLVEPLRKAIADARRAAPANSKLVYLSPQGKRVDQAMLCEAAQKPGWIFLAGRYEGVDERLIESDVDEEWSIGDYVLSGGELAAMVVIDGLVRQVPGVLGHEDSADQDSFVNGLLDYPHYTRPEIIGDQRVPAVLLSGDHQAIARWRLKQSLGRTWLRRPDLLESIQLDDIQTELLEEFKKEQRQSDS